MRGAERRGGRCPGHGLPDQPKGIRQGDEKFATSSASASPSQARKISTPLAAGSTARQCADSRRTIRRKFAHVGKRDFHLVMFSATCDSSCRGPDGVGDASRSKLAYLARRRRAERRKIDRRNIGVAGRRTRPVKRRRDDRGVTCLTPACRRGDLGLDSAARLWALVRRNGLTR